MQCMYTSKLSVNSGVHACIVLFNDCQFTGIGYNDLRVSIKVQSHDWILHGWMLLAIYRSHDQQPHFWSLDILLIMTDTETVWILMVGEYRNCRTV